MMKENKMILVLGVLGVAAIVAMIIFRGPSEAPKPQVQQNLPQTIQPFHPERVREFSWITKQKTYSFKRENHQSPWTPPADLGDIASRISAIGMSQYINLKLNGQPRLTVKVVLDDKTTLTGGWDGNVFAWTEGSLTGKGFQTLGETRELFQAGTYAFDSRTISWCPARIGEIVTEGGGPKFRLAHDGSDWAMERGSGRGNADTTFLENWFGRHCQIRVDQFVDPELVGSELKFEQKISVTFADKKSGIIQRLMNAPIFKMGNHVFISRTFNAGVADLLMAPFSGKGTSVSAQKLSAPAAQTAVPATNKAKTAAPAATSKKKQPKKP